MERDMTESEEQKKQDKQAVTEDTPQAAAADAVPVDFEEDPPKEDSPIVELPESPPLSEEDIEEEEPDEPEEQEPEFTPTLETVIEAVLFAGDEPIKALRLTDVAEAGSVKQVRQCVKNLNRKYRQGGFSFRIEKIAGGYQMMTLPVFNPWLSKLIKVRSDSKLSPAALETLAIISYKQPIIRAEVEAIRGVASGEVIRNLMYKGLVKIVGRAEVLGRPMQYGTTKKFLEVFGLNSLKDLPNVEELKNPQS